MPRIVLNDFVLATAERRLILAALVAADDLDAAAAKLGITRAALRRKSIKHGLPYMDFAGLEQLLAAEEEEGT